MKFPKTTLASLISATIKAFLLGSVVITMTMSMILVTSSPSWAALFSLSARAETSQHISSFWEVSF